MLEGKRLEEAIVRIRVPSPNCQRPEALIKVDTEPHPTLLVCISSYCPNLPPIHTTLSPPCRHAHMHRPCALFFHNIPCPLGRTLFMAGYHP